MTADPAAIAAARQVLAHLGVTVTDLQSHPATPSVVPTVAEYLPRVVAAAGPGARRTFGTYWDRMAAAWTERPLVTITASDVDALKKAMVASAVSRHSSRNGRHTGEHVIAAARAFYRCAIADGLIDAAASPPHRVANPDVGSDDVDQILSWGGPGGQGMWHLAIRSAPGRCPLGAWSGPGNGAWSGPGN